jgi:hypothetical protein
MSNSAIAFRIGVLVVCGEMLSCLGLFGSLHIILTASPLSGLQLAYRLLIWSAENERLQMKARYKSNRTNIKVSSEETGCWPAQFYGEAKQMY